MKPSQQVRFTAVRSAGKVNPTVATWVATLSILFGASILASSLGLERPEPEVRAQQTMVVAGNAIGDPAAPVSAHAKATSSSTQ